MRIKDCHMINQKIVIVTYNIIIIYPSKYFKLLTKFCVEQFCKDFFVRGLWASFKSYRMAL